LKRFFFALPFVFMGLLPLAQGCGTQNGLVGGACVVGFEACGTECVDLDNDSNHCGTCSIKCGNGLACLAGKCVDSALVDGSIDGSGVDGAFTDGEAGDGSSLTDGDVLTDGSDLDDGSLADGSTSTDGQASTDGSTTSDAGNCFPPYNTLQNCGTCGNQCAPDEACQIVDGGFDCVSFCNGGQINCNNVCVDTSSDPFNCGSCNKFCPSGICTSSVCTGSNPGDLIVIGNDYTTGITGGSSQARLLTNSVLIGSANPLHVFSYETFAAAASVSTVRALVTSSTARSVQFTVVPNDGAMQSMTLITNYDVILIYDQKNANGGTLTTLGNTFGPYLLKFLTDGGTVVILDGASGAAQAMPQFIKATGLLDIAGHTIQAAGTRVTVTAPSDVVGVQVLSPFAVSGNAVSLQLNEAAGGSLTYVTREGQPPGIPLADPTVIHKNF